MRAGRIATLALLLLLDTNRLALAQLTTSTWREIQRTDSLVIETLDPPTDGIPVRATATLPASRDVIAATLLDLQRMGTWLPRILEWNVVESAQGSALVDARYRPPWLFADRVYRARIAWHTQGDGVFVLEAHGEPSNPPSTSSSVVILEQMYWVWRIVPAVDGGSSVTFLFHGELGGSMPYFVQRMLWKRDLTAMFAALRVRLRES